jgi:hypothetical protein
MHENISQFITQLRQLADGEAYRIGLFSLSLTESCLEGGE